MRLPIHSLRHKILLGYVAIGTLILGLSLAAFMDLLQLERRIDTGSRITDFLNMTLELRRYEKNFFLYRKREDLEAFRHWLEEARNHYLAYSDAFSALLDDPGLVEGSLSAYGAAMTRYAETVNPAEDQMIAMERHVRLEGKHLSTLAETMAATEKEHLFQTLQSHRQALGLAIAMVMLLVLVAGRMLARMVTQPLQEMERTMRLVADGDLSPIPLTSDDREIVSLHQAFNRMLMELHARQKMLVRSEKLASLGTMLSGVAHELNNPLSNISTSSQILLEEPDLQPLHREMLEQIDSQTLRARHIVRALLDFARQRPFLRETFPVGPLFHESLRLVRAQLPPGVSITTQVEENLTLYADRQRIQQALLNLIKNAADALHGHGEIHLRARALPEAMEMDTHAPQRLVAGHAFQCRFKPVVEIQVQDTGEGIDAQTLSRILDPFFTTKEAGQGSGLGLFITHEIVEEHSGCMVVDSTPGGGATFRLLIPRMNDSEQEIRP